MIAKDQFVDALLDFDIRLRIKQSRPKSLNDDVRLAVEIETLCIAERSDNSNNTDARHVSGFPLKCNHCGRRWHEIKDCFMRSNQKKTVNLKQVNIAKPSSRTKGHDTYIKKNATVGTESSLFINAIVDKAPCNLLVDTVATLTILANRIFENIKKTGPCRLEPFALNIVGADWN